MAGNLVKASIVNDVKTYQLDLFNDYSKLKEEHTLSLKEEKMENRLGIVINDIKNKYGKNAILKGMNYLAKGTTIKRNSEIGGHKA